MGNIAGTALVLAFYAFLVYAADRFLPAIPSGDRILHVGVSVLFVTGVSTVVLAATIFASKGLGARRLARDTAATPAILDELVRIAGGAQEFTSICLLHKRNPRAVEAAFVESLGNQKGSSLGRLGEAAEACGIPTRWRRQTKSRSPLVRCAAIIGLGLLPNPKCAAEFRRALHDSEELVIAEAARALIRGGETKVLEELLLELPRQTRLMRALLSEWLRKHSVTLSSTAIPAMLRSDDRITVIAALEVLGSWRRALLIPDLQPLLRHADPAICAAAWNVAPYVLGTGIGSEEYGHALGSDSAEVRAACLNAVARLKITAANSYIERAVYHPDTLVARAAARAMALFGERGDLERIATSGVAPASTCATEALEKLMIGRLEQ